MRQVFYLLLKKSFYGVVGQINHLYHLFFDVFLMAILIYKFYARLTSDQWVYIRSCEHPKSAGYRTSGTGQTDQFGSLRSVLLHFVRELPSGNHQWVYIRSCEHPKSVGYRTSGTGQN